MIKSSTSYSKSTKLVLSSFLFSQTIHPSLFTQMNINFTTKIVIESLIIAIEWVLIPVYLKLTAIIMLIYKTLQRMLLQQDCSSG